MTDTEICNLALNAVGERQGVTALGDTTAQGTAINNAYTLVREKLLASSWWSFASKQAVLAQSATAPTPDWAYAYDAPTDMLAPRYVWSGGMEPVTPEDSRVNFAYERGAGATVGLIYCDEVPITTGTVLWPQLKYTYTLIDATKMPAHFADAFVLALAARLALALPVKPQLAVTLRQEAEVERQKAVALDRTWRRQSQRPDARHIRARGGVTSWPR
jgi:hypothetical protein